MGLSDRLATAAVRHAHALLVEVGGSWHTRAVVEHAVLERGWRLASSPADADLLVVCGVPGPRLAAAIDVVWDQLPGPRARIDVHDDDVAARLDEAQALLLDGDHQRHDAGRRAATPDVGEDHGEMDHGEIDHGEMDHGEMDHGDMEMAPGGVPLAEGGEDRDGLEMDVLHVRLGPVLPYWPGGLVLDCALQGDLVAEAGAELLDADDVGVGGPVPAARALDHVVTVLSLAGWDVAAADARRLRNLALQPEPVALGVGVERLRRRVRRSRLLRWSLRHVAPLTEDEVRRHGLWPSAVGDTHDRLLRLLDDAVAAAGGQDLEPRVAGTDAVAQLVTGLDVATARLAVAGLGLDRLAVAMADREVSHG